MSNSAELGGNVAHVKLVVRRQKARANGPLFASVVNYTGTIRVTSDQGDWSEFKKESGRTSFAKVQAEVEEWKKSWIAKGLKAEQIEIDYRQGNPC